VAVSCLCVVRIRSPGEVSELMNYSLEYTSVLDAIVPGTVVVVRGPNFSGRTDLLRAFTAEPVNSGNSRSGVDAYVSAEIYNSLSGLASTVKEEIGLHAQSAECLTSARQLFSDLGLNHLYGRNPFTLSGGEQALLAVTATLVLQPRHLSIDCALEQLDADFRSATLNYIESARRAHASVLIADNRLPEYHTLSPEWLMMDMPPANGGVSGSLTFPSDLVSTIPTAVKITLDGLSFKYPGGAEILRNVSIVLEPGNVYLLSGKNGSGKSTLAKLLCGVLRPTKGTIVFDDIAVEPWKAPGQIVAYHFQNPDLQLFATSVDEELQLGIQGFNGARGPGLLAKSSLLALFALQNLLKDHPLDLPFVIRKRVAMAATLAMRCSWVVLDEPTLGQDQGSIRTIAKMINLLASNGLGVVIINHSDEFRSLLAEPKTLRLSDGDLSSN
jgi:energy-coupling factor transporter ATP-binding protein EcfA2